MALTMWGQVVIQAATPGEDPVQVGTVWVDTSGTPTAKLCTAIAPYTFSALGAGIADGDKGDITVSGTGATWTIDDGVVTPAKMNNGDALSVLGRSANTSGVRADIAAGTDHFVLRRSGTALGFGLLVNNNVDAAAAIAYSKLNLATSIVNADVAAAAAIAASKLAPPGSTKEIIYNDASTFATDSVLAWDKTNKRFGIGTASPANHLSVHGPGVNDGGKFNISNSDDTDWISVYSGQNNDPQTTLFFPEGNFFNFNSSTSSAGAGAVTRIKVDGSNGFTAIGRGGSSPFRILDLLGADNDTVMSVAINATQANLTAADTFIEFRSSSGIEATIQGTAAAGVIAYNTFTGAHKTLVDGAEPPGLTLLEMTGQRLTPAMFKSRERLRDLEQDNMGPAPKGFLPVTRVCATKGSKACYGVFAGADKEGLATALALGTGWILVANKGVNLSAGDYLISSDVAGHAERQADDIKRSSTVASMSEDVVWQVGETRRRVAVRYLMG